MEALYFLQRFINLKNVCVIPRRVLRFLFLESIYGG